MTSRYVPNENVGINRLNDFVRQARSDIQSCGFGTILLSSNHSATIIKIKKGLRKEIVKIEIKVT